MTEQEQREYLKGKITVYKDLSEKILQKSVNELDETDFGFLVAEGSKLCKDILGCLVQERGYHVDYEHGVVVNVFKEKTETTNENVTMDLFDFCVLVKGILPKECIIFIKLIKKYTNKTIHANKMKIRELIRDFSEAMTNFLNWFDNHTDKKFQISNIIAGIVATAAILPVLVGGPLGILLGGASLAGTAIAAADAVGKASSAKENAKNNHIMNQEYNNLATTAMTIGMPENKSADNCYSRENSDEIDPKAKTTQYENVEAIYARTLFKDSEKIAKILELSEKNHKMLKNISQEINSYQQLVERQLEKAITEDEIEHLLSAYTDKCAERVINNMTFEEDTYKEEEEKLIQLLGIGAWQKMEDISRTHLTSARVAYKRLQDLQDVVDYSGVCLSVCKALEVELHKRFYAGFKSYLSNNFGKDYTKYHTALLFDNHNMLKDDCFSLGTVQHLLGQGTEKRKGLKGEQRDNNNKAVLLGYVQECLLSKYSVTEIEILLKDYAESVDKIRTKFRNPAAHKDKVQRVQAKTCFDFVIDVEKFLKKMLDSFDR